MSAEIWASQDGTAGGLGTRSMPYDVDTAQAAVVTGDRILLRRGLYTQATEIVTAGITVEGVDGKARFYGGTQITGTWALYSGSVWRVAKAASPRALIIRTRSGVFIKGEKRDSLGEVTDDFYWYWTGGYLYLYSTDGDPGSEYYRVDDTTTQGTNGDYAGGLAYGGIYLGYRIDDVTLRNIGAIGFYGNGMLADDVTGLTCEHCEFSYNGEDGGGGFGMVDWTVSESEASWNGNRRVRIGELVSTDGDGLSSHLGAVESTNYNIKDSRFVGNCKDAFQNINAATGVFQRNYVEDCAVNLIFNGTATQTIRNTTVVCSARCPGAFAIINVGTCNLYNVTFIGAGVASVPAINFFFGVGTVNLKNAIITGFDIGIANTTGTLNHSYNLYNVTTRGVTLGTGEADGDPELYGSKYGIRADSVAAFVGTDLTTSGSYDDDRYRRGRLTGEWSLGAVEVVEITPRGRAMEALCSALETIGDDSDSWQSPEEVTECIRYGATTAARIAPFVEITRVEESYERASTQGMYARTLTVGINYVLGADWESFDWIGAAVHDVELAIGKDRTLGGNVRDCTFTNNTSKVDNASASVSFTLNIIYRTTDTNPLQRV